MPPPNHPGNAAGGSLLGGLLTHALADRVWLQGSERAAVAAYCVSAPSLGSSGNSAGSSLAVQASLQQPTTPEPPPPQKQTPTPTPNPTARAAPRSSKPTPAPSAASPSARTAASSPPPATTRPSSSGPSPRSALSPRSPATATGCAPPRSAPTGGWWCPRGTTAASRCLTSRAAGWCGATRTPRGGPSARRASTQMGPRWPAAARTRASRWVWGWGWWLLEGWVWSGCWG